MMEMGASKKLTGEALCPNQVGSIIDGSWWEVCVDN